MSSPGTGKGSEAQRHDKTGIGSLTLPEIARRIEKAGIAWTALPSLYLSVLAE